MESWEFLQAMGQMLDDKLPKILDERLPKILDERLDEKLDKKFDEKLNPIYQRLDKIDERLEVIDERLEVIDARLEVIDERLDKLEVKVGEIDKRLITVELSVENKVIPSLELLSEGHEPLVKKVDALGTVCFPMSDKVDLLWKAVGRNSAEINILKSVNDL